ncbi:MAG: acyltransferase family protein [Pseudomonadota bacterium]
MRTEARTRRQDIDILRAFAVIAVCLFHFDMPGFDGGFLGVDVFFVISGYLITEHIRKDIKADRFSFLHFYIRRIRRLVPALIAVTIVTCIAGGLILPRSLFIDAMQSAIAALLYTANLYFWNNSNYFDADAVLKPLLHTWSLGVEEQFYLFWPVFLLLVPLRLTRHAILIAGASSLFAAEYFFDLIPSAVFYLFSFRVFEFAIGAFLACIAVPRVSKVFGGLVGILSLAVIIVSFILIEDTTPNPGLASLPVCLATAGIIAFQPAWMNAAGVHTRVLTRIGLVSYSAYLVHWPLVVYYKILDPGDLDTLEILAHLAATYVLAELLYTSVEKPFQRLPIRTGRAFWIGAPVAAAGISAAALAATPLTYQMPLSGQMTVTQVLDLIPDRRDMLDQSLNELTEAGVVNVEAQRKTVVVVGDSHAVDTSRMLMHNVEGMNIQISLVHSICDPLTEASLTVSVIEHYGDHPQDRTRSQGYCEEFHSRFLHEVQNTSPDIIVFGEAWRRATLPFLNNTINELRRETGSDVVLLGRNPVFLPHPNVVFRDVADVSALNPEAAIRRSRAWDDIDVELERIAEKTDALFIARRNLVCQEESCDILSEGEITYVDGTHWSRAGFELFGARLMNHPDFARLLE